MSRQRLGDLVGATEKVIAELEAGWSDYATIAVSARILKALRIPLSRYRIVFPDLPFQPQEVSMPADSEVVDAHETMRRQRLIQNRDRRRRNKLLREQAAARNDHQ